jgi:hypothetical protein
LTAGFLSPKFRDRVLQQARHAQQGDP